MDTINKADLSVAVLRGIDVAWIIALHQAIYAGDFIDNELNADAIELTARSFVAQLPDGAFRSPDTILSNLAKLNIQVSMTAGGSKTQIKSSHDLQRIAEQPPMPSRLRTICISIQGFGEYCRQELYAAIDPE